METRERFRLTLRKERLEEYLQNKRIENFTTQNEVKFEKTVLKDINEKLENCLNFSTTVIIFLDSSDLNIIKYTISFLRKKISIQKFLSEFKSTEKFGLTSELICQLLNCLEKYEKEKEIQVKFV